MFIPSPNSFNELFVCSVLEGPIDVSFVGKLFCGIPNFSRSLENWIFICWSGVVVPFVGSFVGEMVVLPGFFCARTLGSELLKRSSMDGLVCALGVTGGLFGDLVLVTPIELVSILFNIAFTLPSFSFL